jgi:phosphorylcholine metabolism protein LicD
MNKIIILIITLAILTLIILGSIFLKRRENIMTPLKIKNHNIAKKEMINMFREFVKLCDKYNINYWANGGTFIGTVRNKGFIPWDGDVDITMPSSDIKKLEKVVTELSGYMWYQTKYNDPNYLSDIRKIRHLNYHYDDRSKKWHNGIQLDIFEISDNIYKKGRNVKYPSYYLKTITHDDIFPLKKLQFEDFKVNVPNKYKKYSKLSFGDYPPKNPPLKNQICHEGDNGLSTCNFLLETPEWTKKMYPNLYK